MACIPAPIAAALPLAVGIGLKPAHYPHVLAGGDADRPDWVEVHPQNYFGAGGPPHRWLSAVADIYPLSFHSTGLSIGSAEGLDARELDALAALVDRYHPTLISDHLSWSVSGNERFPDLLPMPYTLEALAHVVSQVAAAQDRLKRPILIENPSRYLGFAGDDMSEAEFLDQLCCKTGCGLLLDVNNIIVSATNLGLDAIGMIDAINTDHVGEVHVAGHSTEHHAGFTLCIDDHGSPVSESCWNLCARFLSRAGPKPILVEWDTDVPDYGVLMAEAARAAAVLHRTEAEYACAA